MYAMRTKRKKLKIYIFGISFFITGLLYTLAKDSRHDWSGANIDLLGS